MFHSNKDASVIKAETYFADYVVEHNLPVACTDHAGSLFRKMFPDSSIASNYAAARTKTSHIIETLADEDSKHVESVMQKNPYSIGTDGSNDMD